MPAMAAVVQSMIAAVAFSVQRSGCFQLRMRTQQERACQRPANAVNSSASAGVKMSSSSESAGEEQDATGPTPEEQRDHFSTDGQEGIFNYQENPLAV